MVLNYIWIAFFLIAFVVALGKLIFAGDTVVFTEIINSSFVSAKTGFEISLGLTGILSLWLGIMKIGERGGDPGGTVGQYLRQPAGTGQCSDTDGAESNAATTRTEY